MLMGQQGQLLAIQSVATYEAFVHAKAMIKGGMGTFVSG